jgi:tyrosyl-tRNA synthetase
MEIKKRLALEIVRLHHGEKQAQKAQREFEKVFQNQKAPSNLAEFAVKPEQTIIDVLVNSQLAPSKSEAKRLIEQKAVDINGQEVTDCNFQDFKPGSIIKVGKKKFLKIK